MISFFKGMILPAIGSLLIRVVRSKELVVRKALDDLVSSPEAMQSLFAKIDETSLVSPESVGRVLAELVKDSSKDVLERCGVDSTRKFERMRRHWLEALRNSTTSRKLKKGFRAASTTAEHFRVGLVEHYLKKGVPVNDLHELGHIMKGNCKLAGFKASDCKELANFTAEMCREAGFTITDCTDAGFSLLQCKEAGFTARDFKHHGFTAKQCKDLGFSAHACRYAEFTATECQEAGFVADDYVTPDGVAFDSDSSDED